jgi:hypothetical protein
MQFWYITVCPEYVNFVTFSKDLLTTSIILCILFTCDLFNDASSKNNIEGSGRGLI